MQSIMENLRTAISEGNIREIGGRRVERVLDYSEGLDGLPKSDVIKFVLEGKSSMVIRPSGTEPKLKAYISICADTEEQAAETEAGCRQKADELMR